MEKNGIHVNGAGTSGHPELTKELAQLRVRLAEIVSMLRRAHGSESSEARLAEEVSASVQRLEAQLCGCPSARFE